MILDRLLDLRQRLDDDPNIDLVPEAHKRQTVRWVLPVSEDGRVGGPIETGAKRKDWTEFVAPFKKRQGTAPQALLLVDKPDYVLGLADEDTNAERSAERHEAYLGLLADAAEATGNADLALLRDALGNAELVAAAREALTATSWKPGDLVAPRVGEVYPHRNPAVQSFWIERENAKAADKSDFTAVCMRCGVEKPIARTHPVPLIVGGNTVGLVTGNANAFLSHGLKQSEIAPLCGDCARGYGEALRYLLQSDTHSLYVGGGVTWLFWTREPVDDTPFRDLMADPDPASVQRLLRSTEKGHQADVGANQFYALVVSANKSRLVVRDWLALPVWAVQESLARYFKRQRIQTYEGDSPPLKLLALAGALVRDLKDLPPQSLPTILDHALRGTPLPLGLLHLAVQRARAEKEHPVTRPRAALIRLVLESSTNAMTCESLNEDHPEPAYHCGRLLAILDKIQRRAISPNATLVDRFYGSASTTPVVVFGTLMRKAQPHVAKLRTGKGDPWLDRRLGEIACRIPTFPTTLTPEQQGLFALGFYHEKYRPYEKADVDGDGASEASTELEA